MNPKVSIIIPIYNAQIYLKQCVESVLGQSMKDLEVVLIDDGSTDESGKMCDIWKEMDKRVKVLHIDNMGVSNARNKGLEIAKGEFIMFVDSDDWMNCRMVETLYNKITSKNLEVVFCDYIKVSEEKQIKCEKVLEYQIYENEQVPIVIRNMFGGGKYFSSVWRGIYRKSIIDQYNIRFENIKFAEDMLFNIEYLFDCKKVEVSRECLYYYRENLTSSLQKLKNDIKEMQKLSYKIYKLLNRYDNINRYADRLEKEIELTIKRIFEISQNYQEFAVYIKQYINGYSSMLIQIPLEEKVIKMCMNKKVKLAYVTLWMRKIDNKIMNIFTRG